MAHRQPWSFSAQLRRNTNAKCMINEEWNKTQNDAHFVAFYDMRAVTIVLSDEMADV